MLTSSQSGRHEIDLETVESGQGIARDFNYMRNGDQAAPWAGLAGRTGQQVVVILLVLSTGKMQRVTLWMQAVEHIGVYSALALAASRVHCARRGTKQYI